MGQAVSRSQYSSELGGMMVDFAISIPMVLAVLFTAADLFRVTFMQIALMDAVGRGAHYAALGFKQDDDPSPSNPVTSVRNVIERFSGYPISAEQFSLCNFDAAEPDNYPCKNDSSKNTRGKAGEWMFVAATKPVAVLFGAATIRLRYTTTVRNEPQMVLTNVGASSGNTNCSHPSSCGNLNGGSTGGGTRRIESML